MEVEIKIWKRYRSSQKGGKRIIKHKVKYIIHFRLKCINGVYSYEIRDLYKCIPSKEHESLFPYKKLHGKDGLNLKQWEGLKNEIINKHLTQKEIFNAKMEFWEMLKPINFNENGLENNKTT